MLEPSETHQRVKRDSIAASRVVNISYGPVDAHGYVNVDTSQACIMTTFLGSPTGIWPDVNNHNNSPSSASKIIASLYWAVTTTTSTGYGEFVCVQSSGTDTVPVDHDFR